MRPPTGAQAWIRARALFEDCVDLPRAERDRRIAQVCADDAPLRGMIEALFRSHDALGATRDDGIDRRVRDGIARVWREVAPGERIGAFRVLRELARGGMGVVYLAERDDGTVAQRVALKLVAGGPVGADAAARLAREYRLLASLEHPNIARLIDAGTSPGGAAYFAMEYVDGRPFVRWCDEVGLSLQRRLALFREVCAAVQFAHAKLVVHRDLKSANILVRDDGLPKLLDFGIATTLAEDVAQDTGDDGTSGFLSPHAAAPEQFRRQDAGVATDIYALGVLLCELAGGKRPIDVEGLDGEAAMRRVEHAPPRLPSEAASVDAAHRRGLADAAVLRRALEGDIDAIVAHCLEKDPARRYASVALLADDIERHLARRPIAIRAHERGYRARRFVRRHAIAVGFGALAAALLVGFVAYGIVTNRELARQRDEARMREQQAVFQRSRAEAVTDFLVGLFRSTAPEQTRGHAVSARELVDKGRASIEAGLAAQPDLRASMLSALSDVYLAFDDLDTAERLARAAIDLDGDGPMGDPAQKADALLRIAAIANRRTRPDDALAAVESATALVTAPDAETRSRMLSTRAEALRALGRTREAVPLFEENVATATAAYGDDDPRVLRAAMQLAGSLRGVGRVDDAQALLSRILPRMRRNLAADDPALAEAAFALAMHARNAGRMDEALPLAREALDVDRRVYGENASRTERATTLLATIESALGHADVAYAHFARALAIDSAIYGDDSVQAATAEFNLGSQLQAAGGRNAEALDHLQRAVAIAAKRLPVDHINPAIFRIALGSSLREARRYTEADAVLRQALAVFEAHPAPRGLNAALTRGELACNDFERAPSPERLEALKAAAAAVERIDAGDSGTTRISACRSRATAGPRPRK